MSELRADFVPKVSLGDLLEALTSLERRCLIDKATPTLIEKNRTFFTLQPVVREYMTDRLIEQVCKEVEGWNVERWESFQELKVERLKVVRDSVTQSDRDSDARSVGTRVSGSDVHRVSVSQRGRFST